MGKHEECEAPAGAPPPIPNRDAERGYKKVACEPNVVAELASRIQREEDKIAATRQLATSLSGEEKELKAHLEAEMEETGMLIEALRQNLEVLKQERRRSVPTQLGPPPGNPPSSLRATAPGAIAAPPPTYHPRSVGPPLLLACERGDVDAVKRLFKEATIEDLQFTNDPKKKTPLHLVSENGNVRIVDGLLRHPASDILVSKPDAQGDTPLHYAAKQGHELVVHRLIVGGANLDALDDEGNSPLHEAASSNSVATVATLLEAGALPSLRNKQDKSARDVAETVGNADIAKLLTSSRPLVRKPSRIGRAIVHGDHPQHADHGRDNTPPAYTPTQKRNSASILQLPPGWERRICPKTNKLFYINHNDKSTHWQPPADAYYVKKGPSLASDSSQQTDDRVGPDRRKELRQEEHERAKRNWKNQKSDPLDEIYEEDWW